VEWLAVVFRCAEDSLGHNTVSSADGKIGRPFVSSSYRGMRDLHKTGTGRAMPWEDYPVFLDGAFQ